MIVIFDLKDLEKFLTNDQLTILSCNKKFELSDKNYKLDKLKFTHSINSNQLKSIDHIELLYKGSPITALTLKANPNKRKTEYYFLVENYDEIGNIENNKKSIFTNEASSFRATNIYNCVVRLKKELANMDLENVKFKQLNDYLKEIAKFTFSNIRSSTNIEIYSNLVNHSTVITPRVTDIIEFVYTCVNKFNDLGYDMPVPIETLGIEFHTEVNYDDDVIMVDIDDEFMEIVIIEIVTNSFKFSIDTPKINIKIVSNRENVYINFYDEGIGFPLNSNNIVFDPFQPFVKYQSPSLPKNFYGLGLGLSIAKLIINSLLGEITIINRDEGGCLVTISLPIVKDYSRSYRLAEPQPEFKTTQLSNFQLNFAEILDLNLF